MRTIHRQTAIGDDALDLARQEPLDLLADQRHNATGRFDTRAKRRAHMHLHGSGLDLGKEVLTVEIKQHER